MAFTKSAGHFLTLEGGDGSGKSTLLSRLEAHMKAQALPLVCTREPGGTQVADEIREILLKPGRKLSLMGELFLFEAARAEHVELVIKPNLAQGTHVLCDRFTHSTLAFQGYARGLGAELIQRLNALATGGLEPSAVIWLKISPEAAQARIKARGAESRIDAEKLAFHQSVYEAFERMAENERDRFIVLDATRSPDEVFQQLLSHPLWRQLFPAATQGAPK